MSSVGASIGHYTEDVAVLIDIDGEVEFICKEKKMKYLMNNKAEWETRCKRKRKSFSNEKSGLRGDTDIKNLDDGHFG